MTESISRKKVENLFQQLMTMNLSEIATAICMLPKRNIEILNETTSEIILKLKDN